MAGAVDRAHGADVGCALHCAGFSGGMPGGMPGGGGGGYSFDQEAAQKIFENLFGGGLGGGGGGGPRVRMFRGGDGGGGGGFGGLGARRCSTGVEEALHVVAAKLPTLRHKPSLLRKHVACVNDLHPAAAQSACADVSATPSGGVPTRRGTSPAVQWAAGRGCGQAGAGPALTAGRAGAGGMFGGDGMDDGGGGFGGFGGCGASGALLCEAGARASCGCTLAGAHSHTCRMRKAEVQSGSRRRGTGPPG